MSIDYLHSTVAACMAAVVKVITRLRVRWAGCRPDVCQRIYFANHTSHADALLLWAALDPEARSLTRPVAARDYWTAGPVRRYLAETVFHAVMIDRLPLHAQVGNPLDPLLAALRDGHSSLIYFPEGTRGKGPEAGTFKGGLFHLAKQRPDVELVPTLIENTHRILPKGEIVPTLAQGSLSFGAPMHLEPDEEKFDFLARARAAVNGLRTAA